MTTRQLFRSLLKHQGWVHLVEILKAREEGFQAEIDGGIVEIMDIFDKERAKAAKAETRFLRTYPDLIVLTGDEEITILREFIGESDE